MTFSEAPYRGAKAGRNAGVKLATIAGRRSTCDGNKEIETAFCLF